MEPQRNEFERPLLVEFGSTLSLLVEFQRLFAFKHGTKSAPSSYAVEAVECIHLEWRPGHSQEWCQGWTMDGWGGWHCPSSANAGPNQGVCDTFSICECVGGQSCQLSCIARVRAQQELQAKLHEMELQRREDWRCSSPISGFVCMHTWKFNLYWLVLRPHASKCFWQEYCPPAHPVMPGESGAADDEETIPADQL